MKDVFFISHSIYLTTEEIKFLTEKSTTIETVGIVVIANPKDIGNKLAEVFVRYLITNEIIDDKNIEPMPDGYKISLPHIKFKPIADSNWLMINLESSNIIHQVIFKH